MRKKTGNDGLIMLSFITWLLGVGNMLWAALSLSWLRLFIGMIFISFSIIYAYSYRDSKDRNKRR